MSQRPWALPAAGRTAVGGVLAMIAAACGLGAASDGGDGLRQGPRASIQAPEVTESSGLAASRSRENWLWTLNDSGNPATLYGLDPAGRFLGQAHIRGIENRDWEDLAAFALNGRAWLLIADSGDNHARRDFGTLYIVADPAPAAGLLPSDTTVTAAWQIRFRYPDGPRDCEAVAVDAAARRVLLLSKRTQPPVLYDLPLRPAGDTVQIARRLGAVDSLPPPSPADLAANPRYGRLGSQPTALDLAPDGHLALILTYRRAYVFQRRNGEPWHRSLARPPQWLEFTGLGQAEAACFGTAGRHVFVTSEGRGAPLLTLGLDGLPVSP